MAAVHFSALTNRFLEKLVEYNGDVQRISAGIIPFLKDIQNLLDQTTQKKIKPTYETDIFDDVNTAKEIIHFQKPILCCEKIITSCETLLVHLTTGKLHANPNRDNKVQNQIIHFNIYCQLYAATLRIYNKQNTDVERHVVDMLGSINATINDVIKKHKFTKKCSNLIFFVSLRKWKIVLDFNCKVCGGKPFHGCVAYMQLFSSSMIVNDMKHVKSQEHETYLKSPLVINYLNNEKIANYLQTFTMKDIEELIDLGKKLQDKPAYGHLLSDLKSIIVHRYPYAKYYLFGSRMLGLSNKEGDLDVFIDADENPLSILMTVENCLKAYPDQWDNVRAFIHIPVPLVKAYSLLHKIDCDITFSHKIVLYSTEMIKHFFDLQPICLKLTIFMRRWSNKTGLKIHSIIFTTLVIFYMQVKNLLPSVEKLQGLTSEVEECWVGNKAYDVNFNNELSLYDLNMEKNDDFIGLATGFFDYYAHTFDFTHHIVSPFSGRPENKVNFAKVMNIQHAMIVQDFFRTRNCSFMVGIKRLKSFIASCSISVKHLQQKKNL